MSTTVKVVLAVVAFFFLMIVGTCVGGYYWVKNNKDRWKAEAEGVMTEAVAYGKSHEERECLEASLTRLDACKGGALGAAKCHAMAGMFLDRCLPEARASAGFCEGVPPVGEILEGAQWSVGVCEGLGRAGQQPCGQLVSKLIPYCARKAGKLPGMRRTTTSSAPGG